MYQNRVNGYRRFSRELGREVQEVDPEALERLRSYSWPGNIRELQSVLKQALLRASGPVLLPAFLPENVMSGGEVQGEGADDAAPGATADAPLTNLEGYIRQRLGPGAQDLYVEMHRQLDRVLLPRVLESTGGSQHQAARRLGIARQPLRQKLRGLGLYDTPAVPADDDDRSKERTDFLPAG